MTEHTYTFSHSRNSYFGGADVLVTRDDDKRVLLNVKENLLAIEVKDDEIRDRWPADVQAAADVIGEEWLNNLYESAQTAYWEASQTAASAAGLEQVFGAGHSSGWMAVEGSKLYGLEEIIEPPDDEPEAADFAERFLRFAFERVADIEFFREEFFDAVKNAAGRGSGHRPCARYSPGRSASETPLSISERKKLAAELVEADWPSVAADVEDGVSPERVLKNLDEIGEWHSDAAAIVAGYCA